MTAVTMPSPLATAVLDMLENLPPADRAEILRAQIALLDSGLYAKRYRMTELAVAAVAAAAHAVGIELIPSSTLAALEPDDDEFESLESDIRQIDSTLEDLCEALAAIEAGPAEHQRGPAMNGAMDAGTGAPTT